MSGGEKKRNSTLKFRDLKIVFPRGHTFTFWKPMLISFGLHNRGKKTLYSIFRNPYLQRVNVLTREYYLSLTNIKKFRRKFFYCLATGSPYLIHIYNYKGLYNMVHVKNALTEIPADNCVILSKLLHSFGPHFSHR